MVNIKNQKVWWKSTTILLNLVGVLVPVIDLVLRTNLIQDKEIYALILAVLNILNRFRVSPAEPVKPVARKLI